MLRNRKRERGRRLLALADDERVYRSMECHWSPALPVASNLASETIDSASTLAKESLLRRAARLRLAAAAAELQL